MRCAAALPAVMSANEQKDTVFQAIRGGAEEYLVKPVTKKEVQNIWQYVWKRLTASQQQQQQRQQPHQQQQPAQQQQPQHPLLPGQQAQQPQGQQARQQQVGILAIASTLACGSWPMPQLHLTYRD